MLSVSADRRRGGQPGNRNARRHGGYSQHTPTQPSDWQAGNLTGLLQSIIRTHPPAQRAGAVRAAIRSLNLSRPELEALQLAITLELSQ